MTIQAFVRDGAGNQRRQLVDPTGGTFDAARDFDRLIPPTDGSLVLARVDPYGTTTFGREDAAAIREEVSGLQDWEELSPVEHRGLVRLRVMAEAVASGQDLQLVFSGD